MSKSNVESAWAGAARAENWLAKPDELPPDKPLATCKAVGQPPHLDGQFDEPIWQQAEPLRLAELALRGESTTTVQLCRDEEYLYVAITCPRLRGESYQTSDTPRTRDANLTALDRVELALDVDRDYGTAYELTVDCRGWTHDEVWGDASWNPRWFVANHIDDQAWTAEIAIPWAELSDPEPAVLDAWCLRAVRRTSSGYQGSWTGAAGTAADSFGLLLFR